MLVFRIGKSQHARDLTGEGARLFGGRWNHIGVPCLYTAASRALATLEYTVHVNIFEIPRALSLTTIEIDEEKIFEVPVKDLPGNWKDYPAPASTKDFGSILLQAASAAVIKIPSTIIAQEANYLINPLHPDSACIKIVSVEDFSYDVRIKTV